MRFYVGWSHSDALFSDYFSDCPTLVSALPDNRGTLKRFNRKPSDLIIDCGAVYHSKQKQKPTLKSVFEIQVSMIDECTNDCSITLVHYDEPMINKSTLSEMFHALEKNLYNAYEYQRVVSDRRFGANISTMGVIQGFDKASIHFSANELKKMGYKKFGIGSLLTKGHVKQIQFIKYAIECVGAENLHVFGVTGLPQMAAMMRMGISSFDSTRPTMAAAYFQVFYSNPFRTFFLSESRAKPHSPRISEPLLCDCPVCQVNPKVILKSSPREYMQLRSIHNYYHLIRTIDNMKEMADEEVI